MRESPIKKIKKKFYRIGEKTVNRTIVILKGAIKAYLERTVFEIENIGNYLSLLTQFAKTSIFLIVSFSTRSQLKWNCGNSRNYLYSHPQLPLFVPNQTLIPLNS